MVPFQSWWIVLRIGIRTGTEKNGLIFIPFRIGLTLIGIKDETVCVFAKNQKETVSSGANFSGPTSRD